MLIGGWSGLTAQHWIAGGTFASLMWYVLGNQSFSRKKTDIAIAEQCVAVFFILTVSIWAVVKEEWLGVLVAIGVLYVEVRSIRRISASQSPQ